MQNTFIKTLILLSLFALHLQAEANIILPADGESALITPVSKYLPNADADVWDMSQLEIISKYKEVKFNRPKDSAIIATLPGIRYCFEVKGDSIFHISSESHYIGTKDFTPRLYSLPIGKECKYIPVHTYGNVFSSEFFETVGEASITLIKSGDLYLPGNDTIYDAVLYKNTDIQDMAYVLRHVKDIRSDSTARHMTRKTETYIWRSVDYSIPVAQTTVISDYIEGEIYAEPTVSTWICPPIDQPQSCINTLMTNKSRKQNERQNRSNKGNSNMINGFNPLVDMYIKTANGAIEVYGTSSEKTTVDMILTDIAGRVFASQNDTSVDIGSIITFSATNLPEGNTSYI